MPSRSDISTERRAQIIQAALSCFMRKGYTNTTMDDIVAESGLSKGSLSWYFDSKDDLFAAAATAVVEAIGEDAFQALEAHETAAAKIRALAHGAVVFAETAEGLFNLFVEFWSQSSRREEVAQLWSGLLVEYKEAIVAVIEEGVRTGEFRPIDAEQLAWAVMAAYDGLGAYMMFLPDIDIPRISQAFVDVLLRGLLNEDTV